MSTPTVETSTTAVAVPVEALFSDAERAALVGFLAGYSGQTRDAYTLDLRQYTSWCATHGLHLFGARRADIECYGRDLEARGRARATVARRLCIMWNLICQVHGRFPWLTVTIGSRVAVAGAPICRGVAPAGVGTSTSRASS
jgi:hypothetical protein